MLPDRLRRVRKERKLTQEELAARVNTKKTTISNYETGYSSPSNEMLNDLATVLGVTTDYLLGRTSHTNNRESHHEEQETLEKLPPKARRIMHSLARNGLDDEDYDDIARQVEFLIDIVKKKKRS